MPVVLIYTIIKLPKNLTEMVTTPIHKKKEFKPSGSARVRFASQGRCCQRSRVALRGGETCATSSESEKTILELLIEKRLVEQKLRSLVDYELMIDGLKDIIRTNSNITPSGSDWVGGEDMSVWLQNCNQKIQDHNYLKTHQSIWACENWLIEINKQIKYSAVNHGF